VKLIATGLSVSFDTAVGGNSSAWHQTAGGSKACAVSFVIATSLSPGHWMHILVVGTKANVQSPPSPWQPSEDRGTAQPPGPSRGTCVGPTVATGVGLGVVGGPDGVPATSVDVGSSCAVVSGSSPAPGVPHGTGGEGTASDSASPGSALCSNEPWAATATILL